MSVALKVELFVHNAWVDVTAYARVDPGVLISVGVRQESALADANTCPVTFNNIDGRFTPRNTAGAYYPYLTKNIPLRIKVGSTVRFVGEISEFPTRWNENETNCTVTVVASGLLRRLQHASDLGSSLFFGITTASTAGTITGYWPIEDQNGSTSIAEANGGTAGTFTGTVDFASIDPGALSKPVANWNGGKGTFIPTPPVGVTEFTFGFLCVFPATGQLTGGEELAVAYDAGGTSTSMVWHFLYSPTSGGNVLVQVTNSSGTDLIVPVNSPGSLDGQTVYVKMEVTKNGANTDFAISPLVVGGASFTSFGSVVGQVTGGIQAAQIGSGVIGITKDVGIGHLVISTDNQTLFNTSFVDGLLAYAGESVKHRLDRLELQSGITINVTAGPEEPTELGVQSDGSLLDALREAEKADAGGILYDTVTALELSYIARWARYNNVQPDVALNYATKQLVPPLQPTDDDQNLRNDVTAQRANGSSARATLASGQLSVQDYPNGVGPYTFSDTYGIYLDAQLPYLASWLLGLGTQDVTRWPAITIDLVKNPTLVADVEALRPGSPVVITNLPASQAGTSTVHLQVIGWTEAISSHTRTITLNCVPGEIWNVFTLNDTVLGVLDVDRLGY